MSAMRARRARLGVLVVLTGLCGSSAQAFAQATDGATVPPSTGVPAPTTPPSTGAPAPTTPPSATDAPASEVPASEVPASTAEAQVPTPAPTSVATPKTLAGADELDRIPKDPKGIKGISPFWKTVRQGDSAYLARDFGAAAALYQDAIKREPQNPLGHYRLGQAESARGQLDAAAEGYAAALRFSGSDPKLRAKALFVIADLNERRQALDSAAQGWTAYQQLAQKTLANGATETGAAEKPGAENSGAENSATEATGAAGMANNTDQKLALHPNTAIDRRQKIELRKKLLEEYGAVRKRIEERLKQAEEKAQNSAR